MRPASPDHSTRIVIALGTLATVAALLMGTARAEDATGRTDENGKPCPTEAAPARGLSPLTFCSPALDRAKAGTADPEFRGNGFGRSRPGRGACTSNCVTVHMSNGTTYQRHAPTHR